MPQAFVFECAKQSFGAFLFWDIPISIMFLAGCAFGNHLSAAFQPKNWISSWDCYSFQRPPLLECQRWSRPKDQMACYCWITLRSWDTTRYHPISTWYPLAHNWLLAYYQHRDLPIVVVLFYPSFVDKSKWFCWVSYSETLPNSGSFAGILRNSIDSMYGISRTTNDLKQIWITLW